MNKRKRTAAIVIGTMLITSVSTLMADRALQTTSIFENKFDAGLNKLKEAHALVNKYYIHPIDEEELVDGALQGMMRALGDPHSMYMDAELVKRFHEQLQPHMVRIGVGITTQDGELVIESVEPDSAAEKAGLKPQDKIIKVDDKELKGLNLAEKVGLLRGPEGSKVELVVERPGTNGMLKFSIVRAKMPVKSVRWTWDDEQKTGIIKVLQFAEETDKEFAKALEELERKGMTGLVIDVRDNPGGILQVVKTMLDQLVPVDQPLFIVENSDSEQQKFVSSGRKDAEHKKYPIAVVVNGYSASAAEVLAASLQEMVGAKLVGEDSYGKGTVQVTAPFADGSNIKLTIAKWLTPLGQWVDRDKGTKGVKPDFVVNEPEYFRLKPPESTKEWRRDDNNESIQCAQKLLKSFGYRLSRTDGYFDNSTEHAIKEFQLSNQLEQTGSLNKSTVAKLQEAWLKLCQDPKNDLQMQEALRIVRE